MEGQLWCYAFWMDKTTVTGWAFNLCLNNEMEEGNEWLVAYPEEAADVSQQPI